MGCVIGKIEYCEHDKETAEDFTGLQDVYRKLCLGITDCDVTEARKCGTVAQDASLLKVQKLRDQSALSRK